MPEVLITRYSKKEAAEAPACGYGALAPDPGGWEYGPQIDCGETIESGAIVTSAANKSVHTLRDRTPVVLQAARDAARLDLSATETAAAVLQMRPYEDPSMYVYHVSHDASGE